MMKKKHFVFLLFAAIGIFLFDYFSFYQYLRPHRTELIFSPEQIFQQELYQKFASLKKFTFDGFLVIDGQSRSARITAFGDWSQYLHGRNWYLYVRPEPQRGDQLPKDFFVLSDDALNVAGLKSFAAVEKSGPIEINKRFKGTIFKATSQVSSLASHWILQNEKPKVDEAELQKLGVDILELKIKKEKLRDWIQARNEIIQNYGVIDEASDLKFPAELTVNNQNFGRVDFGFKGDWAGHINSTKWSMKVKLSADQKYRDMDYFSIQDDLVRGGSNEVLFMKALQKVGVITPRYFYVYLKINGNPIGLMQIEERWNSLLPSNSRRQGIILSIDESELFRQWEMNLKAGHSPVKDQRLLFDTQFNPNYFHSFKLVPSIAKEKAHYSKQFKRGFGLIRGLMEGKLKPDEVFDMKTMALYNAALVWWGGSHALIAHNQHFYYNPILDLLEPIGYDANTNSAAWKHSRYSSSYWTFLLDQPSCKGFEGICVLIRNYTQVIESEQFRKFYFQSLNEFKELYFKKGLKEELKAENEKILQIKKAAHEDINSSTDFEALGDRLQKVSNYDISKIPKHPFIKPTPREITDWDNLVAPAQAFIIQNDKGALQLEVRNIVSVPVVVRKIATENEANLLLPDFKETVIQSVSVSPGSLHLDLPYSVLGNESKLKIQVAVGDKTWWIKAKVYAEFLEKNFYAESSIPEIKKALPNVMIAPAAKTILFQSREYKIHQSLTLPFDWKVILKPGADLQFCSECLLYIRGPLVVEGSEKSPVLMRPLEKTWAGIVVDNRNQRSEMSHLKVTGLSRNSEARPGDRSGIVIYGGEVKINFLNIEGAKVEDALNIVNAKGTVTNSNISSVSSDGLDGEFSDLKIENIKVQDCGDDGLDFGTTLAEIVNASVSKVSDKAISIGQRSKIKVSQSQISDAKIGISVKGHSEFLPNKISIEKCQTPYFVSPDSYMKGDM